MLVMALIQLRGLFKREALMEFMAHLLRTFNVINNSLLLLKSLQETSKLLSPVLSVIFVVEGCVLIIIGSCNSLHQLLEGSARGHAPPED